ncbi:NAD(P)H-hydrate dehydratase [Methylobacterium sp. BTF04]|uniref:NAD(P)H-hydrate dehydratase n=1 Tax=Methylobacterium sp. BTF04 TaxID=2708300 RepID=UPI0013D81CE7|nr:NAD(P)H-hydrate dehydratase [Methylobacterium sp. BTF04]NEU14665.1 NAD(P)H-hydrate dehydratase [Methylobacterium sp. BTF04]
MGGFESNLNVLLTPQEMALADRASIAAGISGIALMEAAGRAVADAVRKRWGAQPILVLCGPGNNGGDGFAAARHLMTGGWPVRLALLGSRADLGGDAAHHAALWTGPVEPFSGELLNHCHLVVDAIFGAGLSRPVDGIARDMIETLIARKTALCAIDVPSGLDGATGTVLGIAAQAVVTVTFFRRKPGHLLFPGRRLCGEVILADIGTPPTALECIAPLAFENGPALWSPAYPRPDPEGNKYQRGHVLVLGGRDVTGASRLTARAAMRVGAGLVTLGAPAEVWAVYATSLTGVMVLPIHDIGDFEALLSDPRRNAFAIGPGAGVGDETRRAVLAALATKRPVVIDADAITSFASDPETLFGAIAGPCVITPHDGEFARIFDPSGDKLCRVRRAAERSRAVVVLKGGDTVIADPAGRAVINANAPANLATGGSGDVLTGLVAGLLAQGLDPFRAASAAVWLHGETATAVGPGLIAEDLPEALPGVLRHLSEIAVSA